MKIQIGEYDLELDMHNTPGKIWISALNGEGGEFAIKPFLKALEKFVEQYYNDNF